MCVHRKQYGLKFPTDLIAIVDETAKRQFKDRTQWIEDAIREKLNALKIRMPSNDPPTYLTDEELEVTPEQARHYRLKRKYFELSTN